MNKINAVLGIVIILLSTVCGILYYQLGDMPKQNSDLQNQIGEYQNQISQLEKQIDTLEKQIDNLDYELNYFEYKIGRLEAQNLELQNQKTLLERELEIKSANWVKITEFIVNETSTNPPAGVGLYSKFVVTVENFGTNTVEGLKVVFDIQYQEIFTGDVHNATINIGTLNAGESRTVSDHHQYGYYKRTFVVNLMIDDIILDRFTITRE